MSSLEDGASRAGISEREDGVLRVGESEELLLGFSARKAVAFINTSTKNGKLPKINRLIKLASYRF
jgi:hypothetical protein